MHVVGGLLLVELVVRSRLDLEGRLRRGAALGEHVVPRRGLEEVDVRLQNGDTGVRHSTTAARCSRVRHHLL